MSRRHLLSLSYQLAATKEVRRACVVEGASQINAAYNAHYNRNNCMQ